MKDYFASHHRLHHCVMADAWKDDAGRHWLGVSTQFGTEDMRIFSPSLGLRLIEERHTSDNIGEMLEEICEEWGILPSLVVSDNASNALGSSEQLANFVGGFVDEIIAGLDSGEDPAESVSNPESHKLPANEDVRVKVAEAMRHVPEFFGCHCHKLELCIKWALKSSPKMVELVESIQYVAKASRNNDTFKRFLKSCAPEDFEGSLKLPRNAVTRWGYFHRVLKKLIMLTPVWDAAITNYNNLPTTSDDIEAMDHVKDLRDKRVWHVVVEMEKLLEPLASIVHLLEADSVPTLSLVQLLAQCLLQVAQVASETEKKRSNHSARLVRFADSLVSEIKDRFTYSSVLAEDGDAYIDLVASALDPRTKHLHWLSETDQELVFADLERKIEQPERIVQAEEVDETEKSPSYKDFLKKTASPATRQPSEVERYRSETGLDFDDGDPLQWWRDRKKVFPSLYELAQIYLAYPAGSGSVERLFSGGKLVISSKRTRLGADAVEAQTVSYQNRRFLQYLRELSLKRAREDQTDANYRPSKVRK